MSSRIISGMQLAFLLFMAVRPAVVQAEQVIWTLESAVRHALEQAPERHAAEAEVAARRGALRQAGAWPNPILQLRADQKLGIEDGQGGTDLTQAAIEQPLPFVRRAHERRAAEASLTAARHTGLLQQLMLEAETARAYHAVQLSAARLALARERVESVGRVDGTDRVVRYQSPLERERLALLREGAHQELANAEGKWSEAVFALRARLGLAPETGIETATLSDLPSLPSAAPSLPELHPALTAASAEYEAARAATGVARARRWGEPVLGVFREQDILAGARREYSGMTLSVQIPLWNRNTGDIARATAEAERAGYQVETRRRDLARRAAQSRLHLGHLLEQVGHFRERLLQPAERTLTLAQRSFRAGETNVLGLIDASNTYFDAHTRHLELLHEAWVEAAELRLATGVSILTEAQP